MGFVISKEMAGVTAWWVPQNLFSGFSAEKYTSASQSGRKKLLRLFPLISASKERARFLGVWGIKTASDISKFTKISRAAAAASDIWGEISRASIYLKYPQETVLYPVYTTRHRNFAPYVTGVIFTSTYFEFGLNTTGISQSHFRSLSACSIT